MSLDSGTGAGISVRDAYIRNSTGHIVVEPAVVLSIPEGICKDEWIEKAYAIICNHGVQGNFEKTESKTTIPFRLRGQDQLQSFTHDLHAAIGRIEADSKPYIPGPSTLDQDAYDPKLVSMRAQAGEPAAAKLLKQMKLQP